ncbi:MAG: DUF1993 domain-containing protein [Pseudohongiellaceae bacterium]|jgi:hypothetical protein
MSLSLHEIIIPNFTQTLNAVSQVLAKGAEFAREKGETADSLLELGLHETMWPLRPQLVAVMHHSLGAIRGIQNGEFHPPTAMPDKSYADFQQLIADTVTEINAISADDINSLEDLPMKFKSGSIEIGFTGGNFLLSFSLPNFYFHATTAYDILRKEGVGLNKMDYMGQLRKN